jgi:hypothetical protein
MTIVIEERVEHLKAEPKPIEWNKFIDPWSRRDHIEFEKVIAVDFDETITDDPETWLVAMRAFERGGYVCKIVTWRYAHEGPEELQFLVDLGYKIYYTGRKAKRRYMADCGVQVAIWIDDNPWAILHDCQ